MEITEEKIKKSLLKIINWLTNQQKRIVTLILILIAIILASIAIEKLYDFTQKVQMNNILKNELQKVLEKEGRR